MFNLEQSISEWRKQMLAAGIKSPVPLEELEIHLREEIERQTKSSLSEAEAFQAAVQKIGTAQVIQNEFRKVEAIKKDREWKSVQIMFVAATSLIPIFMGSAIFSKHGGFSEMTPGQQTSGLAALATFTLLAWSGRSSCRLLPVIQTKRIRDAILYLCGVLLVLWWIVFLNLIVPRYDFTMGQLVVTVLWAYITPAGAWIGLHWGIETAARKKVAMADLSGSER